jgi:hypothetical protein
MIPSRFHLYALRLSALACLGLVASCEKPAETPETQPPAKTETAAGPKYWGNIDVADCDRLDLWAWDESQPDTAVQVEIYDGKDLLATVTADNLRKDLKEQNKGNGKHGFSYQMPATIRDGKPHVISVKISGTNFTVPGSPKTLVCPEKEAAK